MSAAQQLLAAAWQYPVTLRIQDVIRTWGRHTLLRCRVKQGPTGAADFLIVKAANQPGRPVSSERAGLELLAELPAVRELVPRLHAADAADSLLVLEDIGNGPSLGQLLQARAGWAQEALLASMGGLAAVHTATRGRQERYLQLRARNHAGPPVAELAARRVGFPELTGVLARALHLAGLDQAAVPTAELEQVVDRMSPPDQLRCLTFYDQCPSNRMMVGDRLRFIDLELVAFGHPFLDAAYPLLGHLTCMDGLRLPSQLQHHMLATYRSGLAGGYPELVEPGRFEPEIVSACAVWLLWQLPQLAEAMQRDRVVGHFLIRRRQRLLAILDAFITAAETFHQLLHTRRVCRQLAARLGDMWQDTVAPLPLYPIFQGSGTRQAR